MACRVATLCLITEREHVRSRYSASGAGAWEVLASLDRILYRLEMLEQDRSVRRTVPTAVPYVSLFARHRGATAALERLHADAVSTAFSETDAAANAVIRRRRPDVARVGDVT